MEVRRCLIIVHRTYPMWGSKMEEHYDPILR